MVTVESTPGSATANSYCSIAQADLYFSTGFKKTAWTDAAADYKSMSLIEATRLLDTLVDWSGVKSTTAQSLRFPRTLLPNPDYAADAQTQYLSSTEIPAFLISATCELAYDVLKNDGFSVSDGELTDIKVGPIAVAFSEKIKSRGFSQVIQTMISKWGTYELLSSSAVKTVRLVRV